MTVIEAEFSYGGSLELIAAAITALGIFLVLNTSITRNYRELSSVLLEHLDKIKKHMTPDQSGQIKADAKQVNMYVHLTSVLYSIKSQKRNYRYLQIGLGILGVTILIMYGASLLEGILRAHFIVTVFIIIISTSPNILYAMQYRHILKQNWKNLESRLHTRENSQHFNNQSTDTKNDKKDNIKES